MPRTVDGTVVEQRILEAVARLPAQGALSGWAALHAWGAAFFDGRRGSESLPVLLAVGSEGNLRPMPGVTVSRDPIEERERVHVHDLPVLSVERALTDEVRRAPRLVDAVVAIDMTLAAGLTTLDELAEWIERHRGWRRARFARQACVLARAGSRSPGESRTRFVWDSAGLPPVLLNPTMYDDRSAHLLTPDLLEPESGLCVEYDGAVHLTTRRRRRDVTREERARDHGLEVMTVLSTDLWDPQSLAERMCHRLTEARTRRRRRRWTLEQPVDGWSELLGDPDLRRWLHSQ